MALNVNNIKAPSKGQRTLTPSNYMARVVQVIDLGMQNQRAWEGQTKPPANDIWVTYELVTEFMTDDEGNPDLEKPLWISERFPLFSLSSDRARSTQRYTAIDPAMQFGGDFSQLVGQPCLIAVVNNDKGGKTYNNVASVSLPISGMEVPPLINDTKVFEVGSPDMEVWEALPEFLTKIITENLDYQGSALQAAVEGGEAIPPAADPQPETAGEMPY